MSHTPVPDVLPPGPPPGPAPPESTAPPSPAPPSLLETELLTELLGELDPSDELPEAPDPSVELLAVLLGDADALEALLDAPPDKDDAAAELELLEAPLDPDGSLDAPEWVAVPELPEVSEPPEFIDTGAADGAGLDEHPLATSAAQTSAAAHAPRATGSRGLDSQPQTIRPLIFTPPSIRGPKSGSREKPSVSVRRVRRTCRWRIRPRQRCSSRPP